MTIDFNCERPHLDDPVKTNVVRINKQYLCDAIKERFGYEFTPGVFVEMSDADWKTLHEFFTKEKLCGIISDKCNQYEPKTLIHDMDAYMRGVVPAETIGAHIRNVLGPFQSLIDLHNVGKDVPDDLIESVYTEASKSLQKLIDISKDERVEAIIHRPEEPFYTE